MDVSGDDNTAVHMMKRDFQFFLSQEKKPSNTSRSHLPISGSFLDEENPPTNNSTSSASISMQQIFEKDKEERQKQAEFLRQKTYINKLESSLSALQAAQKRAKVEMEQEMENNRQEVEAERERNKQTRHQLNLAGRREEELKETLAQLQQEMNSTRQKLEMKIRALQAEKLSSQTDADELEMSLRQKISEQKREILRQQTEYEICKTDLQETKEQLDTTLRKYTEMKQKMSKLEVEEMDSFSSQVKIKALEQQLETAGEDSVLVKSSKEKLARYAILEQENKKLAEEIQYHKSVEENVALLKEQRASLQQRLERAEARGAAMAALQAKYDQLQEKLEQWSAADQHGNKRPMSPSKLSSRVQELQNANAILLEKQGHLQASVTSLEQEMASTTKKMKALNEQLAKEQTKNGQLADFVKRAQKKISLISKERDSYKSIIESYEAELTLNVGGGGGAGGIAARRIEQQEAMLDTHRQQAALHDRELEARAETIITLRATVSKMKEEIVQLKEQLKRPGSTSEADKHLVLSLREQVASLEKQLEKVSEEKLIIEDQMERRHLQGDYDPTKTKVVHFSMNPVAAAQADRATELSGLREENARLRKRVQLLQEGGASADDVTVTVDAKMTEADVSEEMKELKKELESKEKANQRLVEAFKKTSHEFREVCYQLLGYRLDFPSQNQYKLMSMYAESPEDFFLFKNSDDGMQMLGTDFSSHPNIVEKIETYLENGHSIPAFLSSITIDLFNSSTILS